MGARDKGREMLSDQKKILNRMETEGTEQEINGKKVMVVKPADHPSLGQKYLVTAPFKFGGRKRAASNSGGTGRAGRRIKNRGKGGGNTVKK